MSSPFEAKPDYLVCICMGVMYSEIVQTIEDGAKTFDELQDLLGLGTGCSSCVQESKDILDEQLERAHKKT